MRKSPIRDFLAERGAVFKERAGVEYVSSFSDYEKEYAFVRDAVGLTDLSYTCRFQIPEAGLDVFDKYAAGSVANIRFGRVLHSMALNEEGMLEADIYVANDDENFILIGESLVEDSVTRGALDALGAEELGLENLSETTALFSLDGVNAWAVVKDLLGSDVLGLPYLSVETYELDNVEFKLFRAGKTSEFGYLFLVPIDSAESIWKRIEEAGKAHGLGLVGFDTHMGLRLDGRFFNIYGEGKSVCDPLPLGLQWMMDLEGEDYRGREAIMKRRADDVTKKVVGVVSDSADEPLSVGTSIVNEGQPIAEVVVAKYSPILRKWLGLALFNSEFAYANLPFQDKDGTRISTISMPPFSAKSLSVRLDEM